MIKYFSDSDFHKKIIIDKKDKSQCQICGCSFNNSKIEISIANHIKQCDIHKNFFSS